MIKDYSHFHFGEEALILNIKELRELWRCRNVNIIGVDIETMSKIISSITLSVFLILSIQSSFAQIGFKAGLGISDIVFADEGQTPYLGYEIDYMEHRNPLLTFQIGAAATCKLNEKMYLQPELLFIRQGLDYDIRFLYDDITYQIRVNYLHAPLLLWYKGGKGKKSRPGLYTGPYSSFKLKAVKDIQVEGNKEVANATNVKNVDFGIIAGFAIDIDLPANQMILELRTSYGLSNMMDRVEGFLPWYYGPEQEKARNISITLMIGYRLVDVLGKKSKQE